MRMGARVIGLALGISVSLSIVLPSSASAAAYRYWTYWQASAGAWNFATAGPATTLPADGSVEGWRFAATSATGTTADAPQTEANFRQICDGTPAVAGSKRVGLVVDFGDSALATNGETPPALLTTCVVADTDASGYEIMRSIVEVRTDDVGLVCGLAGYPSTGCAELIDETQTSSNDATPAATPDAESSPVWTAVLSILVAALLIVAVIVARRRRA